MRIPTDIPSCFYEEMNRKFRKERIVREEVLYAPLPELDPVPEVEIIEITY